MERRDSWVLPNYEAEMAATLKSYGWMKKQYDLHDADIEVEAMAQVLTGNAGLIWIEGVGRREDEALARSQDLFVLVRKIALFPSRQVVAEKVLTNSLAKVGQNV